MLRSLAMACIILIGSGVLSAQDSTMSWAKPDTVTFSSGALHLKGWLWLPDGNSRVPAVLFNHGSEKKALKYLVRLAQPFLREGYAFFVPFRRGQGLSAGEGTYILAELDSAEKTGGSQQRT